MAAPPEVLELVERFQRDAAAYLSTTYNETMLRRDFLDPLFAALGWDVANAQGVDLAHREVIHEDAIKVGGFTKAPDYCFRTGGERRFFVEAKRPAINLERDSSPAFQLRRYAWSAGLPLSILTDFEEFAVYDCRVMPDKNDKAAVARLLYIKCSDYDRQWEHLVGQFSHDAVLRGAIDEWAQAIKPRKGAATVDAAFLKEIESWREVLARNIAVWNKGLSQHGLNYAVQMTIDRIIFLRIAEDRGTEPYGRLQELLNGGGTYQRLCQLFHQADARYNSGLFHFEVERNRPEPPDDLTLSLTIDDEPLQRIIKSIYYPDSPYEFSVLPVEILGQVYEQFLGKVIHLGPDRRVTVEDKPEVRKAGGVYYTPKYIVDYIVQHTVGKLLEGQTPRQVRGLIGSRRGEPIRILDPACGSGSFLLGAYQYLLNWYRDWYVADGPGKHRRELYQAHGGDWCLKTDERKRILLDHIYGVDIDPQAVEVTKLSLLVKVLEGETGQTLNTTLAMFHERALPDLSNNIKCGNSLIGPDFYTSQQAALFDEEDRYRINAFDWTVEFPAAMRTGGFDAVIGNPPYDVMEKDRGAASWPHSALTDYVKLRPEYDGAMGGKLNLFRFFVVRSIMLLRSGSHFGMIIPLAVLADISCARTRRSLMRSVPHLLADCFPQKDNARRRVFLSAKLSTAVLTGAKQDAGTDDNGSITVNVYPWNSFQDLSKHCVIEYSDLLVIDPVNVPIPLVDSTQWHIVRAMYGNPRVCRLGDISDYRVTRGEINQTIYREFINADSSMSRLVKGVEIGRFVVRDKLSQGQREWFNEARYFSQGGSEKALARDRRIATQRITGVDERLRIVASIIEPPAYFADSTNSVAIRPDSNYRLEYLLGLLNSWLFQWRFKLTSTNNNIGTNELDSMPFRMIDFSDASDRRSYDHMVSLVAAMLDLHRRLPTARTAHDKTTIQRQIDATDRQIDRLVYELYGLTEYEIAIVEQHTTTALRATI